MNDAEAIRRPRPRQLRGMLLAMVLGALLGLPTSWALATHIHTYSYFEHGLGDPEPNAYVHPFLATTDGLAHYSCTAYGVYGNHSPEICHHYQHNHVANLYTGSVPEREYSAHCEGAGLDHHHRF